MKPFGRLPFSFTGSGSAGFAGCASCSAGRLKPFGRLPFSFTGSAGFAPSGFAAVSCLGLASSCAEIRDSFASSSAIFASSSFLVAFFDVAIHARHRRGFIYIWFVSEYALTSPPPHPTPGTG